MTTLEQFLGTLMFSSTNAHILHLKTHGYSKHEALDDFYKEAPEKIDAIAEQTYAHIQPLSEYINTLQYNEFESAASYLTTLRLFIIQSRKTIYNPDLHSNIYSAIDDLLGLIDSTVYKLTKLYEGLDSTDMPSNVEKEFKAGTLTYNGTNVKNFFDMKSKDISIAIEEKLNRAYRIVSRNYVAIYYSKVTKLFLVVYESYNHGYFACAAMPMITIYNPEILTQAKFFRAAGPKEIESKVKEFSPSYTRVYRRK